MGQVPFFFSFYLEEQVANYVALCRSTNGGVFNFDATGGVLRDVEDQKRHLYYCFISSTTSLPILSFISTSHSADTIMYIFRKFLSDVRVLTGGSTVHPRYIVTDFSYALINGVLDAFNRFTLVDYLSTSMKILNGESNASTVLSISYVNLCIAHMIKMVSVRVKAVEKMKDKRKTVIVLFAVLARTCTLCEAAEVYRHIHICLCSPNLTPAVEDSHGIISELMTSVGSTDDDCLAIDKCELQNDLHDGDEHRKLQLVGITIASRFNC